MTASVLETQFWILVVEVGVIAVIILLGAVRGG
jgi:hypothetical protein